MNKINQLIKRFLIGAKKGLITTTFPAHIILFQKNVFIRILRVLGGISIILIITKRLEMLGSYYLPVFIICFIISIIFSFYLIYITIYRIIHIYKNFNSKDLDIRNSPLDSTTNFLEYQNLLNQINLLKEQSAGFVVQAHNHIVSVKSNLNVAQSEILRMVDLFNSNRNSFLDSNFFNNFML